MSLPTIQDSQLARMQAEKKKRAEIINTKQGAIETRQEMLKMLAYLQACGYRLPDADVDFVAGVWAEQLAQYIVTYGFKTIWKAVKAFAQNDTKEFRQIPTPALIIEKAKELGIDPDVEIGKINYEMELQRIEAERDAEVQREMTDEKREELLRKYPNLEAIKEIWR